MPVTSFVVTGTARRAAFRSRCPGYQRLLPGSPRGAGAEGKRKAASPMEAARSVTDTPQAYAVRGRGVWSAAPGEPTKFAGPVEQHMAGGGGFEPPEGVNLQQFSRPPQSAALPSLRRPISWRHENGGASGTRTHVAAVQRRSSPAELWPRENHGRSGGDRTRDHLLPKQVRCRCATLRCSCLALPCIAEPRLAAPGHA